MYVLLYMLIELSRAWVTILVDLQNSILITINAWLAPSLSVYALVVVFRLTLQTRRYINVYLPSTCWVPASRRTGTRCLGTAKATLGCRQYGVGMLDLKICYFMNEYLLTIAFSWFLSWIRFLDLRVTISCEVFLPYIYNFTSLKCLRISYFLFLSYNFYDSKIGIIIQRTFWDQDQENK